MIAEKRNEIKKSNFLDMSSHNQIIKKISKKYFIKSSFLILRTCDFTLFINLKYSTVFLLFLKVGKIWLFELFDFCLIFLVAPLLIFNWKSKERKENKKNKLNREKGTEWKEKKGIS